MEGFTLLRVLPGITSHLDPKQFAVSGKSTQHALVYLLHIVLEALDRGNPWFFADFKKGFDLTDHQVMIKKISALDLHPSYQRWITAFSEGSTQTFKLAF